MKFKKLFAVLSAASMVASVTGEVIYDKNSYIRYRQHETNVVGARGQNVFEQWKKKIKRSNLRNGRSCLAAEIVQRFSGDIRDKSITSTLERFGHYKESFRDRISLMRDSRMLCKFSGESSLGIKVKILVGLF